MRITSRENRERKASQILGDDLPDHSEEIDIDLFHLWLNMFFLLF